MSNKALVKMQGWMLSQIDCMKVKFCVEVGYMAMTADQGKSTAA